MSATIITNVRPFTGEGLGPLTEVVIDGPLIAQGVGSVAAAVHDGQGRVLLPGLIDAHVHLHGPGTLERLAQAGVTTALDMGCWPSERVASLRQVEGWTDIRSAGTPGIGAAGPHARIPGFPREAILDGPQAAVRHVREQIANRVDYLKLVLEAPGPGMLDRPTIDAAVDEAHRAGLKVVAHASSHGACELAQRSGVDVITHVPLDQALDADFAHRMNVAGQVAVPTLTMMQGVCENMPGPRYEVARDSVTALHDAGVPVLAGTDANTQPGVPAQVPHGVSLHQELGLLVEAGLKPIEALRAATVLPAGHFGLSDRGVIAPGKRADLVLLDGDPTRDITATRNIVDVWIAGRRVDRADE